MPQEVGAIKTKGMQLVCCPSAESALPTSYRPPPPYLNKAYFGGQFRGRHTVHLEVGGDVTVGAV